MTDVAALNALDDMIIEVSKVVKPLHYVKPVNEAEQKEKFLDSKFCLPWWKYKELEYDTDAVNDKLGEVVLPDTELGRIYDRKRREVLMLNNLIAHRSNPDVVRGVTKRIYGYPDELLVQLAEDFLARILNIVVAKDVDSSVIKAVLEEALVEQRLSGWRVEFDSKWETTVYNAEEKITVCEHRKFAEIDKARLKVHEVGIHAVRAANGFGQKLKILGVGLPGYLPTEEGLTTYFEEKTGNTSEETMREYAARVIVVDSVCKNMDFRETFDRLKGHKLTDDQAWKLSVRAHRGGGYIKDHVYLQGYQKVKEFVDAGGDVHKLFVGKVGIEHLDLVDRLLAEGVLQEPKYIPSFVE